MTACPLRLPDQVVGRIQIGNICVGQLASPYAFLSVSCAAGENARRRISKIATMLVMPDAARIMATMMN
jgi:hypothetical protein